MAAIILLFGCQDAVETPPAQTSVPAPEGQEVIVTRLVLQTQTIQVPVTPVVDLEEDEDLVELDISLQGKLRSLDPQMAIEDNDVDIIENLFASLTRYDHVSNTFEPELAKDWEVSDDGLTWTFNLRDDIYWVRSEEGQSTLLGTTPSKLVPVRPVVADDVVYAVQRACDPRIPTPDVLVLFIIEGCETLNRIPQVTSEALSQVGVRAVNDRTLEITLTKPASYFLSITSLSLMNPIPVEYVVEMGEEWANIDNIYMSGPFILGSQTLADTRTVLQRNPYWPIPFSGNVDVVNILHFDDEMDPYLLWKDKNLDISPVPASDQTSILNSEAEKVMVVPDQAVFYLTYNFQSEVFSNPAVRKAFGWAIDRERLIREAHGGQGLPMRHLSPPGVFGAPPIDQVGSSYNPDRAREQMALSGYGDCRLMPPVTYMVNSSDLALQQAELLREMWKEELSCPEDQIVIEQVQFGTLLASTRPDAGAARPDLWDLGWASYYPDANNWMEDVLHCSHSENRQNRPCGEVDTLIDNAAVGDTLDLRIDLYRQIERLFFAEDGIEPISPLYVRADYLLIQPWVQFVPASFGGEQYDTYLIDNDVKSLERSR
ncbi:MAG: peptide ABC transporter substrate-binding protein [Candidatus Promineifilaceae bacterium]